MISVDLEVSDFGGYTHAFKVKESNEIDNMDVGDVRHIDFQDGHHLSYYKLYISISKLRWEIDMILVCFQVKGIKWIDNMD